jgi:hypothetical protein
MAAVEGVVAVSLSLLVLDRFRRLHDTQGPGGRILADAAYGAFVLQGPVLVAIALALRDVGLARDLKFLVLAVTGTGLSFALAALAGSVGRTRTAPR